jgi:hypothetical protein
MIAEATIALVAGFAKGVMVVHGAIMTAPAAGHRRRGAVLAPKRVGTIAHLKGINSVPLKSLTDSVRNAHDTFVRIHGSDGHVLTQIPGTFEHRMGLAKSSDIVLVPQRVHEIGQFVSAVGRKKCFAWAFCGGTLGLSFSLVV